MELSLSLPEGAEKARQLVGTELQRPAETDLCKRTSTGICDSKGWNAYVIFFHVSRTYTKGRECLRCVQTGFLVCYKSRRTVRFMVAATLAAGCWLMTCTRPRNSSHGLVCVNRSHQQTREESPHIPIRLSLQTLSGQGTSRLLMQVVQ